MSCGYPTALQHIAAHASRAEVLQTSVQTEPPWASQPVGEHLGGWDPASICPYLILLQLFLLCSPLCLNTPVLLLPRQVLDVMAKPGRSGGSYNSPFVSFCFSWRFTFYFTSFFSGVALLYDVSTSTGKQCGVPHSWKISLMLLGRSKEPTDNVWP